jgi:AcrR family transcriptional regulator
MPAARKIDGRHARSQRTRAAISRALYELIEAGVPSPTAQEIADRAGVALRSIRQHFETRESLFFEAAGHYAPRLVRRRDGIDSRAPLSDRITRLAAARAEELETTGPLRRAVQRLESHSPSVAAAAERLARERRAEVEHAFGPELQRYSADDAGRRLDRLDALTGGRFWDALRVDLGLEVPEATAQLAAALEDCLLGPARRR